MTGEIDRDLPLHDEAQARSKWRGSETHPGDGELGASGPAGELDDRGQGRGGGEDRVAEDAAQGPPD